jgi:hypothetical protein
MAADSIADTLVASDIRPARADGCSANGSALISDRRFWQQLRSARELKSFLFSQAVVLEDADLDAINLGDLDMLGFSRKGRMPTGEEWAQLDRKSNSLLQHLNFPLRRKRSLMGLSAYFRDLPLVFLGLAIGALMLDSTTRYLVDEKTHSPTGFGIELDFASNLLWILALGGLGTCGYLGTSLMTESRRLAASGALDMKPAQGRPDTLPAGSPATPAAAPVTVEIDLADANLLTTRVIVGIVFSFTLSLPVYQTQESLHNLLIPPPDVNLANMIGSILLPFILGFSTTLVMGIMERFITAAGQLFGFPARG